MIKYNHFTFITENQFKVEVTTVGTDIAKTAKDAIVSFVNNKAMRGRISEFKSSDWMNRLTSFIAVTGFRYAEEQIVNFIAITVKAPDGYSVTIQHEEIQIGA